MRASPALRAALAAGLVVAASAEPSGPLPLAAPIAGRAEFRGDPDDPLAALERADYGAAAVDAQGATYLAFSATHYLASDPQPLPPHLHVGLAKFAADGSIAWTRLVDDDAAYESFRAVGVALTSDGNIAVAGDLLDFGSSALVASFQPDGTRRWVRVVSGASFPLISAGPGGSVAAAMFSNADDKWRVLRWSASGGTDFDVRYGAGLGVASRPSAIDADTAGNTFVYGQAPGRTLAKFLTTGAQQWNVAPSDPLHGLEGDDAGGVYAAVRAGVVAQAFDAAGGVRWTRTLSPDGEAQRIARDGAGHVIVAGSAATSVVTGVYEDDGDLVWTTSWGAPGRYGAGVTGLALDGAGGVYVAATGAAGLGTTADVLTHLLAYDANGALVSVGSLTSRSNDSDQPPSLGVGAAGTAVFATQSSARVKKREVAHALVVRTGAAAAGAGIAKVTTKLNFGTMRTTFGGKFKTWTVKNKSKTDRLVVRVATPPQPFAGGGGEYVVEPRGTLAIVLAFDPDAALLVRADLAVTTSDPKHPAVRVVLSGKGKP